MPTNPKELMLLAAKTNGLSGDDVKPWHLKAVFTLFNEQGTVKDQGTYEEFRVSEHKFKIAFTSYAFSQTDYGMEKGVLRSGAREPVPGPLSQLRNEFTDPLEQNELATKHPRYSMKKRTAGSTNLLCLNETGNLVAPPHLSYLGSIYCLDTDKPALRVSVHGIEPWASQLVHTNIASFQGRYLPRDLEASVGGKLLFKAHLDMVEALHTINDTDFTPPADAQPWPPLAAISAAEAQGLHLQQDEPVYPPIAVAAHVSGKVVLQAIIGKDGRVLSLSVVSGPLMLQQAALDAVRKWIYKPYLVNNEPVEVNTTINVVFPVQGYPRAAL